MKNPTEYNTGDLLPNGAILIAIDPAGYVLAKNEGAAQPYATWEFYRGDLNSTSNGHYFKSIAEAAIDFEKRAGL